MKKYSRKTGILCFHTSDLCIYKRIYLCILYIYICIYNIYFYIFVHYTFKLTALEFTKKKKVKICVFFKL